MNYNEKQNTINGIPIDEIDYTSIALQDGFSLDDIAWVTQKSTLPAAVFFMAAHEEIEQGETLKQFKLKNEIPLAYDETKTGELLPANTAITEEAAAPIALQMKGSTPDKTIDNYLEIFRHDPHYDNIRFNVLNNQAEYFGYDEDKHCQRWILWDDTADSKSRYYCETHYGLYHRDKHNDAMRILWGERRRNPITELLDTLPEWDGKKRCEDFLQIWMKAEDSDYTSAVGQILFDAAVSRAYMPGCKYDLCVVLVGEEAGEGKSTMVRWLALEDEYAGEITDMNRDANKILEDISGKWVVEIGEYMMKDSSRVQDATKAFITRTQDTYRVPFNRYPDTLKRRCIFIATTNHREFLTDSTGSRRWIPIMVHSDGSELFASENAVKDYIRKCYAEAVYRYRHGLCILDLPDTIKAEAKQRQEMSTVEDGRAGIVEEYCRTVSVRDNPYVCGLEIWRDALGFSADKYGKKAAREIREIMRKIPFLEEVKTGRRKTLHDGEQRVFQIIEAKIPDKDN